MTWEIFIFPNKEPNSVSSTRLKSTERLCSSFSSFSHWNFFVFICLQLGISFFFRSSLLEIII